MADQTIALPGTRNAKKGTTLINGLKTITPGFGSVEDVDVTTFSSPDAYREYLPAMRDAGEASIAGDFLPDDPGQLAVFADAASGTSDDYSFLIGANAAGDDVVYSFTGYPRPPEINTELNVQETLSVTFKITGKPSLKAGTAVLF